MDLCTQVTLIKIYLSIYLYGGRRDKQGCVTVMQGCVRVALCLNISKHSWPLPDHHGSPGIMKDHDGLFQGLITFHHGRPKLADLW